MACAWSAFAQYIRAPGQLQSWLPWNWYSLGGTGYCYEETWDELVKCDDLDMHGLDWNGVRRRPGSFMDMQWDARLLMLLCAGAGVLCWLAFHEWLAVQGRGAGASLPGTLSRSWLASHVRAWFLSGRAWPWAWEPRVRRLAFSLVIGVVCGLALPLPEPGTKGCSF